MKPLRVFILIAALLTITGCASQPENHYDEISMEDWCIKDADMPWSGCWKEIQQIDCETSDEFESDDAIGELRLIPDGHYSITWHPFETYTDYAGTYNIDQVEGTLAFNHDNASGFDGDGFYSFRENGDLELIDIWFGSFYKESYSGTEKVSCGYVFRKN